MKINNYLRLICEVSWLVGEDLLLVGCVCGVT